jgi:glycosyltransferase involved in cell wall biosynthesis
LAFERTRLAAFWISEQCNEMGVKVTIGLCVKNSEATIKEAIGSILNQDYPQELMEIIVVDGHSKDKTVSIIEKQVREGGIRHRFFVENKGLGKARQIVVDNAGGDYIVWVDGDIILAKDHVRRQVEFMENHSDVGIAGGKFVMLPNKNIIATLENIEWVIQNYECGQKATSKPLRNFCGGSIYRVKAIRQVGGFDDQIKGSGEDLDVEYRMADAGWLLYFTTDAEFHDRRKETWGGLWKENFWYGYGGHYILHKNGKRVQASNLLAGLQRSLIAYKSTHQKIVFFLPLQYILKKVAWYFGFAKAHIDGYGHGQQQMCV